MSEIAERLIAWYRANRRALPWRDHPDPYAVWISEIMLQQTRVETVVPYFHRWMARFPTLLALASASQEEVLRLWEGLGYYRRARDLHRAARVVLELFGGDLPEDPESLRRLPGIGRYTAAAIASLAFGRDEPVVDGNVRRVLSRLINLEIPADSTPGTRVLWELAADHLPAGQARDYNQALMELGALICTPRSPSCGDCPLFEDCIARRLGLQQERPVLKPRAAIPHYQVTAAVIGRNGKVLIARRPEEGLLGGLWEFPGGKTESGEALEDGLHREIKEELGVGVKVGEQIGVYRHAYTHYRVTLHAFWCRIEAEGEPAALEAEAIRWVLPAHLAGYPMGKIDRQIARDIQSGGS